jgi:hypothetical protein
MVERRAGGQTGVVAVHVLKGDEILRAAERGEWSQELLAAVLRTMPEQPSPDLKQLRDNAAFYQLEYRDGLKATVAMANGIAHHFGFAARIQGSSDPVATWFELEDGAPFRHFAFLLQAIEQMFHTGKPAYPVSRTLLTTGVLDAALHSFAAGGIRRETPELEVRYQPVEWPFAVRAD